MTNNSYIYSHIMIAASTFSILGSFSILLTYFLFKDIRRLRFVEIVFYVSLSDFIASIGSSIGATHNVAACAFQGITTNVFYVSSCFWTVVVTYQLWLIICKGTVISNLKMYHVICWGIPTFFGLIIYVNDTYTNYDGWCFTKKLVWIYLSFYAWLMLCVLIMIMLVISMLIKIRSLGQLSEVPVISSAIQKLILYPIVYITAWVPAYLVDISGGENNKVVANVFGVLLPCLQGFFLSVIFFTQNPLIRQIWWKRLFEIGIEAKNIEKEIEKESDYNISGDGSEVSYNDFSDPSMNPVRRITEISNSSLSFTSFKSAV